MSAPQEGKETITSAYLRKKVFKKEILEFLADMHLDMGALGKGLGAIIERLSDAERGETEKLVNYQAMIGLKEEFSELTAIVGTLKGDKGPVKLDHHQLDAVLELPAKFRAVQVAIDTQIKEPLFSDTESIAFKSALSNIADARAADLEGKFKGWQEDNRLEVIHTWAHHVPPLLPEEKVDAARVAAMASPDTGRVRGGAGRRGPSRELPHEVHVGGDSKD